MKRLMDAPVTRVLTMLALTQALTDAPLRCGDWSRRRLEGLVMIERHDLAPITVDDCAGVSRLLSAILDVEDPLPGRYTLEVSSPGLDRPLVRIEDYERFAGFEARIEMTRPIDGRRRFQGRLRGAEDGLVQIECDDAAAAIPFSGIRRASLVVTDDLIEAAAREANAALSKQ
jgi:ribosome maturation factor RimP